MGLASFNRMRRERAKVEKMEAQRFQRSHEARWGAFRARDDAHSEVNSEEIHDDLWEAEVKASERIGDKVRAGMKIHDALREEGFRLQRGEDIPAEDRVQDVIDGPLRRDHAAEIAGRNLKDVSQPKTELERIDERIPQHKTANEELVNHTAASSPGPTPEMVAAAAEEVGSPLPEQVGNPAAQETEGDAAEDRDASGTADAEEGDEGDEGDTSAAARVRINKDWKTMNAAPKRAIADRIQSALGGEPVPNAEEAARVIQAELDRRSAKS